jgi:SAM-dependent methyltransferase
MAGNRFEWRAGGPIMTDTRTAAANADQIVYWNETVGPTWVAMQDGLDAQLRPLGELAMAALGPRKGERLIDVGCGCGDTTLALARRVGPGGAVTGADISAPMLEVARSRAEAAGLAQARFIEADAQVHAFEPADGVFSRFGVMFFGDPAAALANLRRALKPGGRLAFVCWRPLAQNPWMGAPGAAVAALLPAPALPPDPHAPGPFAFGDRDRLHGLLKAGGFADIAIEPHDAPIRWPDLDTAVRLALRVGPAGTAAREHPDLRDRIEAAVREALAPHARADGVALDSATWIVRAA